MAEEEEEEARRARTLERRLATATAAAGGGEPPSAATSAKEWSGGEVRMMQSNEHTSDRPATMRWDVGKLEETSAARAVVLADESGGSWFEKLAGGGESDRYRQRDHAR